MITKTQEASKARVDALFKRVQALPRDTYYDERGHVLAHFFGALECMAKGTGTRCTLPSVLASLERAVTSAEESAARRAPMVSEEEAAANCPGYAGPAPEGVDYSAHLAANNID